MNKLNQSNSNFLSKFIKEEKYLQNHPLEANKFDLEAISTLAAQIQP